MHRELRKRPGTGGWPSLAFLSCDIGDSIYRIAESGRPPICDSDPLLQWFCDPSAWLRRLSMSQCCPSIEPDHRQSSPTAIVVRLAIGRCDYCLEQFQRCPSYLSPRPLRSSSDDASSQLLARTRSGRLSLVQRGKHRQGQQVICRKLVRGPIGFQDTHAAREALRPLGC